MSQIAMKDVFEDESDRRSAAIVRPLHALTLERRRYDDRLLVIAEQ